MKIYFAVPYYNQPHLSFLGQTSRMAEKSGFEVLNPSTVSDPQEKLDLLYQAQFVLAWIDNILPKGQFMYIMEDVLHDELVLPLPPQYVELIGIGMQSKGIAQYKKKDGIILPGQDSRGIEITNVPTTIRAHAPGGLFGKMVGKGAVNIPDPGVMIEVGIAKAEQMPIIGVGMACPQVGPYAKVIADLVVSSFDHIQRALDEASSIHKVWEEAMTDDTQLEYAQKRFHALQILLDKELKERNAKADREAEKTK